MIDLHHVHLFASDLDSTLSWWSRHFGARVFFDGDLAGSRNIFVAVGAGRIHFYDQAPRGTGRCAVHHLGIRISNLRAEWERLRSNGLKSPHGLREFDDWRYVMVSAPDEVMLELFEFDDPLAPVNIVLPVQP